MTSVNFFLERLSSQSNLGIRMFQANLPFVLEILGCLWAILILNFVLGHRLFILGLYPRKIMGIPGIVFSPFLHGNFNHLFFNSIPLFVLANLVLFGGMPNFICVTTTIILLSGIGTWLVGRKGVHVGASGVIMGYWSYLLLNGYRQGTGFTIALALICVYYFGSMVLNLFPEDAKSSWEMHAFGFAAGLAATYTCPEVYCRLFPALCALIELHQ